MNTRSPLLTTPSPKEIEEQTRHLVQTTAALLFHTTSGSLELVTTHAVEHNHQGLPVISAGRPLTPTDERRIVEMLLGRQDAGMTILPANLLAHSGDCVMWWMPPDVREMYLGGNGLPKRIKTRWPSLVCMVVGRTLHVAAAAGTQRPEAQTPLFHCPTGNVYSDTRVCTGSAKLPVDSHLSTIADWTSVMVDTAFTHDNHSDPLAEVVKKGRKKAASASINQRATSYWMARDGDESLFPEDRLNPLGFTLGEWYDVMAGTPKRVVRGRR